MHQFLHAPTHTHARAHVCIDMCINVSTCRYIHMRTGASVHTCIFIHSCMQTNIYIICISNTLKSLSHGPIWNSNLINFFTILTVHYNLHVLRRIQIKNHVVWSSFKHWSTIASILLLKNVNFSTIWCKVNKVQTT